MSMCGSRSPSRAETKQIAAQVIEALAVELPLTGFRIVVANLETVRYFRDPDGITSHGVINMHYAVDTA